MSGDSLPANIVDEVRAVVLAAGQIIETVRAATSIDVVQKADNSPVTLADQRSDTFLRAELTRIVPCAWLSEETVDDATRLAATRLWVVDPLDGTKEFIAGVPEYAVSVGLVENGQPVLGVIHNPVTREMISAVRGEGAWLDGARVSCQDGGPLLASRSETRSGEFAPFELAGFTLRPVGSVAYKLALVAAGRGSLTLSRGPKWEWDVCAGSLLVAEAGGVVTDIFGKPLRFNQPFPKVAGVVAGHDTAYERSIQFISDIGASDRMAELGRRHS